MLFVKGLKQEQNPKLLHNWIQYKSNYKGQKRLRTSNLPFFSDIFVHILFSVCVLQLIILRLQPKKGTFPMTA